MPGNDCDGSKDCGDYGCRGVKNPNTGVICCQSNSDCPSYNSTNHLKMYCDTKTHTCQTKTSCVDNTECEDNWCCDDKNQLISVYTKVQYFHLEENHTFAILQKDLSIQMKTSTLITKLIKN
jgi:hypothetical protein